MTQEDLAPKYTHECKCKTCSNYWRISRQDLDCEPFGSVLDLVITAIHNGFHSPICPECGGKDVDCRPIPSIIHDPPLRDRLPIKHLSLT